MTLFRNSRLNLCRFSFLASGLFAAAAVLPLFACTANNSAPSARTEAQPTHDERVLSEAGSVRGTIGGNANASAASAAHTANDNESPSPEIKKPYVGSEEHIITSGCYVVCPVFVCTDSARINAAVRKAFVEYGREQPADRYVDYDIVYNDNDLLSIKMNVYSPLGNSGAEYGGVPTENGYVLFETTPINLDLQSGQLLAISDCFGVPFSADFAENLGFEAHSTALSSYEGLVICLSEPISPDRMFMFYDQGLLLFYRKFELLADPSIEPVIYIPAEWFLKQGAEPNSPVGRLLNLENQPAAGGEYAE